ncbi:MAG: hypothetical protein A3C43_00345 [Candidatus Schekmanbacteria bacterium RIFCSPHIGHO2_02_FULL_38_11]|uniref:PpiC domain-containing protein n=1 Tax=Candidatus Schekmanbacteria bacterium RIFCSPLOWO2_12_FULL_38_15 TaxID=1817883 RepID=A0A1F7SDN7_9BACT|nr:MAG: hypothetical protein A2043_01840 [Candidatus Schekmanbacteria bacterium GWA2_38_9]OGL48366.1 MAG: hypothetical protein A3H37_05180 [Candidatus Schekmanbacteria bacterium RIFCSPLOWO2_02_FULL_38_14]OGL51892.1 MAG: hypothetical protein A3G31_05785 [Candidatus Schekmanbacteria bacterium RIFCSPLOWO2_12_FULL_38_15]OGL51961.1 MAG: hypothetical protein A3C43_00345 [Candidatus Schekmanbacteria bacterium RIFCSPHIGHO2_02_FULL_38_11]
MYSKKIAGCFLILLSFIIILPLIAGAEERKSPDKVILAEVGDKKITLQDLNSKISELPLQYRGFFSDPGKKETFLNSLVQQIVLAKKARELKMDQKPEISEKINDITNQILSQELVKEEILKKNNISDEEIKKYYGNNVDKYREPESVKASHILIKVDEDAGEEARSKSEAKAKEILEKAKKGEDFAALAKEFSEDTATGKRGGDLGFFNKGRMVKEFNDVAFKLKPGEISDIVKTRFGYHIIKVEGKKKEHQKALTEVKSQIKETLSREALRKKLDEYTKKLYEESKVVMHPELLKAAESEEKDIDEIEETDEESVDEDGSEMEFEED